MARKNNVVKNTVMLYGFTLAKILFPLLTLPYLTRVLSTDVYGVVSYVKYTMQYMQIAIDFGFLLSATRDIVKARDDLEETGRITGDVLLAGMLLSAASLAVLIGMIFVIPILRTNSLFTLLSFVPIAMTIFLFDYLFRGLERMHVITIRFVVMKGLATLLTFVFVKGDQDIIWIPILDIIGTALAIVLVVRDIIKSGIRIRITSLGAAIVKLKESAVFFASNMATTAFGALNTLVIGIYLPASDIAFWSVSMQLIGAVQTMYNPIVNGIYPEMVKSRDIGLIRKVLTIFMPIIFAGTAFSFFVARIALVIVGGPKYADAVPVFRALLPVLVFSFPAMVLGWPTLGPIGKEREVTKTTIIGALFQVAGLVALSQLHLFTLLTVAVLRDLTELLLLTARAYYFFRYRGEYLCPESGG